MLGRSLVRSTLLSPDIFLFVNSLFSWLALLDIYQFSKNRLFLSLSFAIGGLFSTSLISALSFIISFLVLLWFTLQVFIFLRLLVSAVTCKELGSYHSYPYSKEEAYIKLEPHEQPTSPNWWFILQPTIAKYALFSSAGGIYRARPYAGPQNKQQCT